MDVTKMDIIGRVTTIPIKYETFDSNNEKVGEHELPKETYDVVDIFEENGKKFYVTNRWYKEYKQVPLIIIDGIVESYEPIKIKCHNCSWTWEYKDGGDDKFICHKCGADNSKYYRNGGEILLAPNGKPSNLTPEQYRLVRTKEFKDWFGDWEKAALIQNSLIYPETINENIFNANYSNISKAINKETGEPIIAYRSNTKVNNMDNKLLEYYNKTGLSSNWVTPQIKLAKKFEKEGRNKIISVFVKSKNPIYFSNINDLYTPISFCNIIGISLADFEEKIKKHIKNNNYLGFDRSSYGFAQREENIFKAYSNGLPLWEWVLNDSIIFTLKDFGFDSIFTFEDYKKIEGITIYVFEPNQIKLADGSNTTFYSNNPDIRYGGGGNIKKPKFIIEENEDEDRIEISLKNIGKVILVVTYPRYEFSEDVGEDGLNELGVEEEDMIGKIEHIEIEDEYKGKGYAKILMNKAIEIAKERGLMPLYLNASPMGFKGLRLDDLTAFYESFGFEIFLSQGNNNLMILKDEYKKGGKVRLSKTPAPKSERIYGSSMNKPKSSSSSSSASSITFSDDTIEKIKNKISEHNEKHPKKKVSLSVAKAVVRRGMGAYSSTHRPTIKGGRPNSRVAWGLARLNAFLYKIVHRTSKSGRYSQDNDLISELGYRVKKFDDGGEINNIQLLKHTIINDFQSGSSLDFYMDYIFVVGDDAKDIVILNKELQEVNRVNVFQSKTQRIPKEIKYDLETSTIVDIDGVPNLLILGSGAKQEFRSVGYLIRLDAKYVINEPFKYNTFVSRLKNEDGVKEINIEGCASLPNKFVMANRGNKRNPDNLLIITENRFWENQENAAISICRILIPDKDAAVSEIQYEQDTDTLFFTASIEHTTNAIDDGKIGDSFLGYINNISDKLTKNTIEVDGFYNLSLVDKAFEYQKIEGICIESKEKEMNDTFYTINLVSDNDNEESTIFKIRFKKPN